MHVFSETVFATVSQEWHSTLDKKTGYKIEDKITAAETDSGLRVLH